MARRRLQIVCSSSDDDDDDNHLPQPPQQLPPPPSPPPEQEDEVFHDLPQPPPQPPSPPPEEVLDDIPPSPPEEVFDDIPPSPPPYEEDEAFDDVEDEVVPTSSPSEQGDQMFEDFPQPPPEVAVVDGEVFDGVVEDIDDDEVRIQSERIPNLDSVTLGSSVSSAAVPDHAFEIPDDELMEIADNLSPPPEVAPASDFVASDCPVNDCLRKLGLCMKKEWLESCKLGLQNTVHGFSAFDVETKAKLCLAQALFSDMNYTGAGVLPPNVHDMHLVDLPGPFILQVDEVINISCPLKERYKGAPPGLKRCLKLSMTDGVQRVFGMEYRPIPSKILDAQAPDGFKVVIRNVNVRRGLLMLVPEVLEVLGGSVEELEAARERLVHEVNKPPRGKRSRTGAVPPLSARATLAAWPQNGANANTAPVNSAHHNPGNRTNSTVHATAPSHGNIQDTGTTSGNMQTHHHAREAVQGSSTRQAHQRSTSGESAQCSVVGEAAQHSTIVETAELATSREATEPSSRRESAGFSSFSTNIVENVDDEMVDHMEHPFILSGEKELPFTYLASLSAKWAAVQEKEPFVRGKIKCFMTGVKGFQYKKRSTFDLRVYVEDGSLISEVLVHHNLVQSLIGCSPEEVTAALVAPDKSISDGMKSTLTQFQSFLINFEGTMLVEINGSSNVPVAFEMSQGCTTSDAQLLLQRLKSVTSGPEHPINQSDVINLSP